MNSAVQAGPSSTAPSFTTTDSTSTSRPPLVLILLLRGTAPQRARRRGKWKRDRLRRALTVDVCALNLIFDLSDEGMTNANVLWVGVGTTDCLNLGSQPFVSDCQTLADALEDLYRTSRTLPFAPVHWRTTIPVYSCQMLNHSREFPRSCANL